MDPTANPRPPGADPLLGQTVGNYLVTQKVGEGGMGSVYLAEHPKIGKRVALKVLHAEFSNNQDVVTRFFNEARSVNDIQHPNIVDIIDYGIIPAGPRGDTLVYFIMEFLAGRTLTDALRAEAMFTPERAFSIALQTADALAASHRCGVVHRDLKPDNIMLVQRGREADFVKLLDFGIAKLTGDGGGSRKTRTGIVMGTPWYMSPEQCDGRGFIDHRTDIYALGVVLYEMVAGRMPFLGEGYGEVLVQHLTQPPPPPSTFRGMSPYVEAVILKALEKRPDNRYPTMDEFSRALLDPVSYVEAHGGLGGFGQARLVAQGAMPPTTRLTPMPVTPVPGSLHTPMPTGQAPSGIMVHPPIGTTTPTTLGGSAGQVGTMPPQHRGGPSVGMMIGGVVLAAGAAVAAVLLTRSDEPPARGPTPVAGAGDITPADARPAATETADARPTAAAGSGSAASDAAANGSAGSGAVASPNGSGAVAPTTITLTLTSDPTGALVFLDDVELGETPLTRTWPREARMGELRVTRRGYLPEEVKVDLAADFTEEFDLRRVAGARPDRPPPDKPPVKPPGKPPVKPPVKPNKPDIMEPE